MYEYMNSTSIRKGLLPAVLLLLAGSFFCLQVEAAGLDNIEALMDRAVNDGAIRIIVTMNTPAMPDRASMAAQEFDGLLASAVSAAQTAVIDTLSPETIINKPRRFTYTPQFAVTVTADGLAALYENPNVIGIAEDIPEPPLLDQSVPHIFPSHATSSYSGNGWAVAILDTGVDKAHSFLSGKVVSEACYSTTYAPDTATSVCPGGVSSSTATDSGLPCDASIGGCSHGTHVGGIAAGDGSLFDGVARGADLIAIQVFSRFTDPVCSSIGTSSPCALSYRSDQIDALNRVYALRTTFNISSINMSLGGGHYTSACDGDPRMPIIDTLKSADIATVIASGNDSYTDGVGAPGCISSAVTIGATNDTVDDRAWFSNSGSQLDLYAPGVSINSSVPGGGYASWNGTSMATPHVAGAWAVLKQKYPAHTVDQIENAFKGSGVTVTQGSISRQRIDIDEALGESGLRLTTVEPCRIVDTREAGGMIAADSTRDFSVWGSDSDIQDQGGTGDCGISLTSGAVVLNITSNQAENNGFFTVYPYNSTRPDASILNYTPAVTIANATTTPICQPICMSDITIYSAQDSHVIIDVVGYME